MTTSAIPAIKKAGTSFSVIVPFPKNANIPTIAPIIASSYATKPPASVPKNASASGDSRVHAWYKPTIKAIKMPIKKARLPNFVYISFAIFSFS
jgi:hypothetical protein